jgi:hypothetical protein
MAKMQSIEQLIRATAVAFGDCPGWTKLLAEAVEELDEIRGKKQPATQAAEENPDQSQEAA